jgi:hypothetical protein
MSGRDGVRLLSRQRGGAACGPRARHDMADPMFFDTTMPLSRGGYWLYHAHHICTCPAKDVAAICSPAAAGSTGWADPDSAPAAAFCRNHMSANGSCEAHPLYELAELIRSRLGQQGPCGIRLLQ